MPQTDRHCRRKLEAELRLIPHSRTHFHACHYSTCTSRNFLGLGLAAGFLQCTLNLFLHFLTRVRGEVAIFTTVAIARFFPEKISRSVPRIRDFSSLHSSMAKKELPVLEWRPRSAASSTPRSAVAVAEWTTFWDSFNLSMPLKREGGTSTLAALMQDWKSPPWDSTPLSR